MNASVSLDSLSNPEGNSGMLRWATSAKDASDRRTARDSPRPYQYTDAPPIVLIDVRSGAGVIIGPFEYSSCNSAWVAASSVSSGT